MLVLNACFLCHDTHGCTDSRSKKLRLKSNFLFFSFPYSTFFWEYICAVNCCKKVFLSVFIVQYTLPSCVRKICRIWWQYIRVHFDAILFVSRSLVCMYSQSLVQYMCKDLLLDRKFSWYWCDMFSEWTIMRIRDVCLLACMLSNFLLTILFFAEHQSIETKR
jgi:hypothetical protein